MFLLYNKADITTSKVSCEADNKCMLSEVEKILPVEEKYMKIIQADPDQREELLNNLSLGEKNWVNKIITYSKKMGVENSKDTEDRLNFLSASNIEKYNKFKEKTGSDPLLYDEEQLKQMQAYISINRWNTINQIRVLTTYNKISNSYAKIFFSKYKIMSLLLEESQIPANLQELIIMKQKAPISVKDPEEKQKIEAVFLEQEAEFFRKFMEEFNNIKNNQNLDLSDKKIQLFDKFLSEWRQTAIYQEKLKDNDAWVVTKKTDFWIPKWLTNELVIADLMKPKNGGGKLRKTRKLRCKKTMKLKRNKGRRQKTRKSVVSATKRSVSRHRLL